MASLSIDIFHLIFNKELDSPWLFTTDLPPYRICSFSHEDIAVVQFRSTHIGMLRSAPINKFTAFWSRFLETPLLSKTVAGCSILQAALTQIDQSAI